MTETNTTGGEGRARKGMGRTRRCADGGEVGRWVAWWRRERVGCDGRREASAAAAAMYRPVVAVGIVWLVGLPTHYAFTYYRCRLGTGLHVHVHAY